MNDQSINMLAPPADDELDLIDLLLDICSQWKLVAGFAIVAILAGIIYLNAATYNYTAQLLVAPAQSSGMSGDRLSNLSGLASLAGVDISEDPSTRSFRLYAEGLRSRDVAEALTKQKPLIEGAFSTEWDTRSQQFKEPQRSWLGHIVRALKSILGIPNYPWKAPGPDRMQEYISGSVKVSSGKSTLITLTYENPDPKFALTFMRSLHKALDDNLRYKALDRSNTYISYLKEQLNLTSLVEQRNALAQMLLEQERIKMMASSSAPYAADSFGPVTVSLRPTSPKPALFLVITFTAGVVLGALVALLRTKIRKWRIERETLVEGSTQKG